MNLSKGTPVQTRLGPGTIAGSYDQNGATIYTVRTSGGLIPFRASDLTPGIVRASSRCPRQCEAYLDGQYRHCKRSATVETPMGWVCATHARGAK